ncbi:MAG: hypothetical protein LN568_03490 [Rickettsia endosymbiont of Pseudomimeciton antennatum]|nr:hypothetical protein [Rickettsia endosymbiont of Pseudomimeciton antennatum]
MANDFDDGKGQEDTAYSVQFDNAVRDIRSQIHTTNPAELARLNASITSLLSSNLPSKILSKLQNLQAFVREREDRAEQVVRSTQEEQNREAEEARLLQEHIEFLEKEAHLANEVREQELKQHFTDYASIKDKAHEQNQEDIALLDQAAKNPDSLTAAQRAQLMGQYATDEEREEAEKKRQQMKKCWETHYAIKNKTNDTIAHKQNKIKANDVVIRHPNTSETEKEKRRQENTVLEGEIVKHRKDLVPLEPLDKDREKEREKILALVNSSRPELAIKRLKDHYSEHRKDYEQERQKDTNHQGYQELHSMVMALGGHEKLGLPEPKYPIAEQPIPALPKIKSSSALQNQDKESFVDTPQNPHERADVIKKTLEQDRLVKKHPNIKDELKNEASKLGSLANQNQVSDKAKTTSTMSKFSQRGKAMEGRG